MTSESPAGPSQPGDDAPGLVVGIGVSARAQPASIIAAVGEALTELRRAPERTQAPVLAVTTWAAKADHAAVRALAAQWGVPVWAHDAAVLRARDEGSPRVRALTATDDRPGIGSVARAAVLASGARPLHDKRIAGGCTYVVGWREASPRTDGAAGDDPLRHHGDSEARGCRVDLAVNVVFPKPPARVVQVLHEAIDSLAAYPDERPARARLAAHLGVDADRLLLVNGAAEAFMLLAHARQWRAPVVVHPQFTEPDAALRGARHEPVHHLLAQDDGFALRPERVPAHADLVVIGNPTNPTSRLHAADDLRAVRRAGPDDRLLVVDEAFMDTILGERESLLRDHRAGERTGICVVRSLTKTFAIAGLRAGYVVGDPDLIARLREIQPPWSVNALALAAIETTADSGGQLHTDVVCSAIPRRRERLVKGLTRAGLRVVPEAAGPFVLAYHPQGQIVREKLRERGIAVRRGDTFPGLGPGWLRLAVRDGDTTDLVVREIRAIVAGLRPRRTRRRAVPRPATPRAGGPRADAPTSPTDHSKESPR